MSPDRLSSCILGASAAGRHERSNRRAGLKRYKHTCTHTHPLGTEEKSCWTDKQTDGRTDSSETPRTAGGGREKTLGSRVEDEAASGTEQPARHTHTHTRERRGINKDSLYDAPPRAAFPPVGPPKTQSTCEPNHLRQGLPEAGRLRQDRVDGHICKIGIEGKPARARAVDRCFRFVCSASRILPC